VFRNRLSFFVVACVGGFGVDRPHRLFRVPLDLIGRVARPMRILPDDPGFPCSAVVDILAVVIDQAFRVPHVRERE